jgi:hypothetical protein
MGAVVAWLAALSLAGCSDSNTPDATSEAFTGPLSNDLLVSASTDCGNGRIGAGDTLRVTGRDYMADAVVALRWSVPSDQDTGTWPSITADDEGQFSVPLKVTSAMGDPGDTLTISSEGAGETGVMVLTADIQVGDC